MRTPEARRVASMYLGTEDPDEVWASRRIKEALRILHEVVEILDRRAGGPSVSDTSRAAHEAVTSIRGPISKELRQLADALSREGGTP